MQKIRNIEFLRTFLICSIVMLHMFIDRTWCLCNIFPNISLFKFIESAIHFSNNAVEGFFIIAGFLLVLTFKNISVGDFIKKKYIRLSPPIAFSMLICLVGWYLGVLHFKLIPNILTVLLLNQFGYCWADGSNKILWFTSVLFACLLLYFCVLKFSNKKYLNIKILILTVLGFGILEYLKHGSFGRPLVNYYHLFNVGFLRGLGGVGLGCLIGNIYKDNFERIKNIELTKIKKTIISCVELFLLGSVFWWLCIPHAKYNCILFVLTFAFLFILFILKKGYISEFFDKDIWVFLGKYQYSMYVVHYVIIKIFGLALWKNCPDFVNSYPIMPIIIMLATILIFTVFTYHFVEEPCAKYLKQKLFNSENPHVERISGGG